MPNDLNGDVKLHCNVCYCQKWLLII